MRAGILLRKYTPFVIRFLMGFFLLSCQKDNANEADLPIDPCSQLVKGVFQYPAVPPPDGTVGAKLWEYWNVPEEVLTCMKSGGLIETCLGYHEVSKHIILGGLNGVQTGYDYAKTICRAFNEMEATQGALDSLITKYISIDTIHFDTLFTLNNLFTYGTYDFYCYTLEAMLGQEVFLKNATIQQQVKLLTELLVKHEFRVSERGQYFFEGPAFVMSRIMYLNNYHPFMEEYEENSRIKKTVTWGSPTYTETKMLISSLARNYLKKIK